MRARRRRRRRDTGGLDVLPKFHRVPVKHVDVRRYFKREVPNLGRNWWNVSKVTGNPALSMNPPHYAAACTDRPATQTSRMFARAAE
jgi:hypothetical protein